MKKRMLAALCVVMMMLGGCTMDVIKTEDTQKQAYASFFPIYALSGMLLEDVQGIDLKCLVQPQDDCLRLYDISDWDASVLAYDADLIIIGGRGLESFESALYTFGNDGPAVIAAMHGLELHNEDGSMSVESSTGHLSDANPYLYMSVPGARRMLSVMAPALAMICPDEAEKIADNYEKADAKLSELEKNVGNICSVARGKSVILMNEALIYPATDYGMEVVFRYDRESGTTLYGDTLEAAISAFEETGADVILIEKQAPAELTLALENAGFTVVRIDIMTSYPTEVSVDYYADVQLKNARAIADAFK